MSRVHFVGGEKGGVGKSVLARLLCQWCVDSSSPWAALDADPVQSKLLSGYGERCQAVDLSAFESADQIIERALGAEREVVVDLPARSQAALARWLRDSDVFGLAAQMGVELVFWQVTDGGFASVSLLEKLVPELPRTAQVVLVRNQRWTLDFGSLEASALTRQVAERGGRVLDLPPLDPQLMYKLEARKTNYAFLLSEDPSSPEALSPMERQRLAHWLRKAQAQLEPILGPAAREAATPTQPSEADLAPAVGDAQPAEETAQPAEETAQPAEETAQPAEESTQASLSGPPLPPTGTSWLDGARTWTERGEGYQIHHVRYR